MSPLLLIMFPTKPVTVDVAPTSCSQSRPTLKLNHMVEDERCQIQGGLDMLGLGEGAVRRQ